MDGYESGKENTMEREFEWVVLNPSGDVCPAELEGGRLVRLGQSVPFRAVETSLPEDWLDNGDVEEQREDAEWANQGLWTILR